MRLRAKEAITHAFIRFSILEGPFSGELTGLNREMATVSGHISVRRTLA